MAKYLIVILILVGIFYLYSVTTPEIFAHQNGCHRWHSCPSDTGSYTCGDTGYCSECPDNNYCKSGQPISYGTSLPTLQISSNQPTASKIPSWIKNNAKWWSQGQIGDSDFINGMQYLIQNGMMKIPQIQSSASSSNHMPNWIKNNAGWWANGKMSDNDFITGIQYLVQNGIIETHSSTCKVINNILPDPKCTQGAIDLEVTQDNIDSTICINGYTKTVRPSTSVTNPIKLQVMQEYGFTDSKSNYELDHLIPLEIGGALDDVKNLWPEPDYTNPSSYDKDRFENYLHAQVCSGNMDLQTAQNEIATNWVKYWNDAGRP